MKLKKGSYLMNYRMSYNVKNAVKVLALTALVPVFVLAQSSLDEEVNAELDRLYKGQATTAVAAPIAAPVQTQVAATNVVQVTAAPVMATATPAPIAAPMAAPVAPTAIKQPTTYIEASPLVESKAEKLRKNRQDAEVATEQGIVEKLEQSRLEDEKKRAEVLFGDKFNNLMSQGQQQTAPAQVAAPISVPVAAVVPVMPVEQVVVAAPAAKPEDLEKKAELDKEVIRGEVSAQLAELNKKEEKPKLKSYMSVMAGSADYPDAVNVKPQYSLGLAFGKFMNDNVILEGGFQYSNYQIEQKLLSGSYYSGSCVYDYQGNCFPRITEMNQYSTSALLKYQIFNGMLRPELGGLFAYTYRTFTDKQFALSNATLSSQALDFGVMAGVSIEVSESFSVGVDMRYMWNLTNKVDGTALQKSALYKGYSKDTPIEDLSYWNTSVSAKTTF